MNPSSTLSRYLGQLYLKNLVFMTLILWGVIYIFDTVELLRRASKNNNAPLSAVLEMGLMKLPDVGFKVLSFSILFSAMFTFWQLNRRHELVVVRSAGFSAWQFLSPLIGIAAATGILLATFLNPFGAMMVARFKTLENTYLTHHRSDIALFDEGLWLRQPQDEGYVILHAARIKMPDWRLSDVMVLYFSNDDGLLRRVDAPTATLDKGAWKFMDATVNDSGKPAQALSAVGLPTDLTAGEIEESFSSPETMSFWHLPSFIKTVESTGFDATRLKIYFQSLLATPFLFASMILLAAAVSLQPPRFRKTLTMLVAGIGIGFAAFFMSSFLQALGASHQIPVLLAAWSPAVIMLMLGSTVMLSLEDG